MAEEGETPGPDAVTVMSYVPGATEPPTSIVTVTVVVAPLVTILLTVPVTPRRHPRHGEGHRSAEATPRGACTGGRE